MGQADRTLDILLDLDGTYGEMGQGWWYKIKAVRTAVTRERPFGINYSLTLHDPNGSRVFGIDNAHGIQTGSGPGRKRRTEFDHAHRGQRVTDYEYASATELLADFFKEADRILEEKGIRK